MPRRRPRDRRTTARVLRVASGHRAGGPGGSRRLLAASAAPPSRTAPSVADRPRAPTRSRVPRRPPRTCPARELREGAGGGRRGRADIDLDPLAAAAGPPPAVPRAAPWRNRHRGKRRVRRHSGTAAPPRVTPRPDRARAKRRRFAGRGRRAHNARMTSDGRTDESGTRRRRAPPRARRPPPPTCRGAALRVRRRLAARRRLHRRRAGRRRAPGTRSARHGGIEGFIGYAYVPVGIAGPVQIRHNARGDLTPPFATTEGTLVASFQHAFA